MQNKEIKNIVKQLFPYCKAKNIYIEVNDCTLITINGPNLEYISINFTEVNTKKSNIIFIDNNLFSSITKKDLLILIRRAIKHVFNGL